VQPEPRPLPRRGDAVVGDVVEWGGGEAVGGPGCSAHRGFTEQNFGLTPLGPNDARAYNLSGAFNYAQAPLRPVPMATRRVPKGDHILWSQAMQES
jgi:hypothetical protein